MKLKQIVSINDVEYVNVSNDIFGQLMLVQDWITAERPDLEPHWLQRRTDLLVIIGTLFHCGKVHLFSLEDQLSVSIVWTFYAGDPQPTGLLASESDTDEPEKPSAEYVMNQFPSYEQGAPPKPVSFAPAPTPDFEQI